MSATRPWLAGIMLVVVAIACQARGRGVTAAEAVRVNAITLQVGHATLAPTAFSHAALMHAVADSNARSSARDLPPDLDAARLDPARVAAFADGLARLSPASLALVKGRTIRLNMPDLRLKTWSMIGAATLREGFELAPGSDTANPHLANVRVVAPIDAAGGRALLARARAYARDERHGAVARRSAAQVWAGLAGELAGAAPTDAAMAAEVETARRMVASINVGAPRGGMPGTR